MKKFMQTVVMGTLLAPMASLAATYHYIALDGTVEDIDAPTAEQALAIAHANGAAPHSGVKLDVGVLENGENFGHVYAYVSTSGSTKSVTAASVDAAFELATDRLDTSGFLIVK